MKISEIVTYKVIEYEKGLVILYASDKLAMPNARELVIGGIAVCTKFLIYYAEQRAAGYEWQAARERALKNGNLIQKQVGGKVIQ